MVVYSRVLALMLKTRDWTDFYEVERPERNGVLCRLKMATNQLILFTLVGGFCSSST